MRNSLKIAFAASIFSMGLIFTACTNETKTPEEGMHHQGATEEVYYCPMHPEVTGKEGDECDKCGGMKLVKKVERE